MSCYQNDCQYSGQFELSGIALALKSNIILISSSLESKHDLQRQFAKRITNAVLPGDNESLLDPDIMSARIGDFFKSLDMTTSATSGVDIIRPKHLIKPKIFADNFDEATIRFLLGQTHNLSFEENKQDLRCSYVDYVY